MITEPYKRHEFCRGLLRQVRMDIRERRGQHHNNVPKHITAHRVSSFKDGSYEVWSEQGRIWWGNACCGWHAKAQALEQYCV